MKYQQRKSSKEVVRGDVVIYDCGNNIVIVLSVTNIEEVCGRVQHEEKYLVSSSTEIRVESGIFKIAKGSQYCGKAPK